MVHSIEMEVHQVVGLELGVDLAIGPGSSIVLIFFLFSFFFCSRALEAYW